MPSENLIPRVLHALLVALVCWSVFLFGAVYPWAYWPLAVACMITGVAGLVLAAPRHAGASRALIVCLGVLGAAIAIQLVPLTPSALDVVSPRSVALIQQFDLAFSLGIQSAHPISIAPGLTWTGLLMFCALATLVVGASRFFSTFGTTRFITAITVVAVCVAAAGIAQKALYNGRIYGFWVTEMGGSPFGSFVNKNHFAGWMLMALPLTLGMTSARLSRGMTAVRPAFRDRLLWFSSPQASQIALLMMALAIMALSLLLAMSRSGIGALAVALAVTAWFTMRHGDRVVKAGIAAYILIVVGVLITVVGADAIMARFTPTQGAELLDRRGPWRDAWSVARTFPLVGTGLNTYGVSMLFYQTHDPTVHYAQAHNDYLQIIAEGGLLLAMPALACVICLVRDIRRRLREDRGSSAYWIRLGAITSLVAIALQETVDFSLQLPANAALFALVCAIALHTSPRGRLKGYGRDRPQG